MFSYFFYNFILAFGKRREMNSTKKKKKKTIATVIAIKINFEIIENTSEEVFFVNL